MEELKLFIIEIILSLSVSAVVIICLTNALRRLLVDMCGTESRARFWVVYSNIMLVIAPLLAIILFGKSEIMTEANFTFYKTAFGSALSGIFISLVVIGMQINKSIPKTAPTNTGT
jgi:hypothetical protein